MVIMAYHVLNFLINMFSDPKIFKNYQGGML